MILAHQPMRPVGEQRPVDRDHRGTVAFGPHEDGADLRLVDPQAEQRIVQLAEGAQRPELIPGLHNLVRGRGLEAGGRPHRQVRRPLVAVDRQRDRRVGQRRLRDRRLERIQHHAGAARRAVRR